MDQKKIEELAHGAVADALAGKSLDALAKVRALVDARVPEKTINKIFSEWEKIRPKGPVYGPVG